MIWMQQGSDLAEEVVSLKNRLAEVEEEKGNLQLKLVDFEETRASIGMLCREFSALNRFWIWSLNGVFVMCGYLFNKTHEEEFVMFYFITLPAVCLVFFSASQQYKGGSIEKLVVCIERESACVCVCLQSKIFFFLFRQHDLATSCGQMLDYFSDNKMINRVFVYLFVCFGCVFVVCWSIWVLYGSI